jgi:hypothetical protein
MTAADSTARVEDRVPTHGQKSPAKAVPQPEPLEPGRAGELVADGNRYYAMGMIDAALESYLAAMDQNPGPRARAGAIRGIATSYSKLGDKRASLQWFIKYRDLAPEHERPKVDQIIRFYSASEGDSGAGR